MVLDRLEKREGKHVLNIAAPLPHALHIARKNVATSSGDIGVFNCVEQLFYCVGSKNGVGIDRDGELGINKR